MEIRKVQVTGGSSYVITLPKDWIKSLNIKKNDPMGVIVQSDGTLVVTPNTDAGEQVQKVKEFDVTTMDDSTYLFRCLIGAHIAGYTIIELKSKVKMPLFVGKVVRKFTQMTIGQEVIEETNNAITIKDLLNPAEMPFDRTIRRMYIIVKNMHENAISALKKKDMELVANVISTDNDVDRLNWLVGRQHSIVLRDPMFAKKMNTTAEMVSNYFWVSRIIERIGDHGVRIAKNVSTLINEKIDKKIIDTITSASNLSLEIFDNSIKSFIKRDMKASNENIESVKDLASHCEEINTLALQSKGIIAISLGYIVESIRRTGEYAKDISESVINYLIGDEI